MMAKKFEFMLLINGNIICQRYFNVKNYNEEIVKDSYEMRDCIGRCVEYITGSDTFDHPDTMRSKTEDYVWEAFNPYLEEYPLPERKEEDEDVFTFQIKIDNRIVAETKFSGNIYPPKVRYSVDIRRIIPMIVNDIKETLSLSELSEATCNV